MRSSTSPKAVGGKWRSGAETPGRCDDYARQNNSYGLTTLKNRHVAVDGNEVRFRFTGKSGKQW
jgi:DNA topoisomerase IB